jgi:hypothetical protein
MAYSKGDRVKWNWGNGSAEGTVQAVYKERVEKEIKGSSVTRNADADNPAYLIQQDDDDRVLKSDSELSKA